VKSNINSVEVHPQLSNNRHPVDGAPVHCSPKASGGETLKPTSVENDGQELQAPPAGAPTLSFLSEAS